MPVSSRGSASSERRLESNRLMLLDVLCEFQPKYFREACSGGNSNADSVGCRLGQAVWLKMSLQWDTG